MRVAESKFAEFGESAQRDYLGEGPDEVVREVQAGESRVRQQRLRASLDAIAREVQFAELREVLETLDDADLVVAQPQDAKARQAVQALHALDAVAVQVESLEVHARVQTLDGGHATLDHPEVLEVDARVQTLDAGELLLHDAQAREVDEQRQTAHARVVEEEHLDVLHLVRAATREMLLRHAVRLAYRA